MDTSRKTYSFGLTPVKVIEDALPQKYPMELNKADMIALLQAINALSFNVKLSDEEFERAASLRQSILETIGIEEV